MLVAPCWRDAESILAVLLVELDGITKDVSQRLVGNLVSPDAANVEVAHVGWQGRAFSLVLGLNSARAFVVIWQVRDAGSRTEVGLKPSSTSKWAGTLPWSCFFKVQVHVSPLLICI